MSQEVFLGSIHPRVRPKDTLQRPQRLVLHYIRGLPQSEVSRQPGTCGRLGTACTWPRYA